MEIYKFFYTHFIEQTYSLLFFKLESMLQHDDFESDIGDSNACLILDGFANWQIKW